MEQSGAQTRGKAGWLFWIIGGVGLIWNGVGTVLWGGTSFMPDTFLEGQPAAYVDYVSNLPSWIGLTWGRGVLGGVAGSILLLLRNKLAVPVFALSLFGAAANQAAYITNPPPEGFLNLPLVVFIIASAVFLLFFSVSMKRRGVLRSRD